MGISAEKLHGRQRQLEQVVDWLAEGGESEHISTLRRNADKGLPCGSDRFVMRLEKMAGRTHQYRPQGRPKKEAGSVPFNLIIGNTWAWPLERIGQKLFSAIMGGIIGRSITADFNSITRFFMWKGVARPLKKSVLAMYLAPFRRFDQRIPTHIAPRQLVSTRSFLSRIQQNLAVLADKPVLIVWGLRDFAFQEPERLRFERVFPRHRTVLLVRAGHFIQEDQPDEISAAIMT